MSWSECYAREPQEKWITEGSPSEDGDLFGEPGTNLPRVTIEDDSGKPRPTGSGLAYRQCIIEEKFSSVAGPAGRPLSIGYLINSGRLTLLSISLPTSKFSHIDWTLRHPWNLFTQQVEQGFAFSRLTTNVWKNEEDSHRGSTIEFTAPIWLSEIQKGPNQAITDEALSSFFDGILNLVEAEDFSQLDRVLRAAQFDQMAPVAIIAVLRYSFSVRDEIPSWADMLKRAHHVINERQLDATEILSGLDGD